MNIKLNLSTATLFCYFLQLRDKKINSFQINIIENEGFYIDIDGMSKQLTENNAIVIKELILKQQKEISNWKITQKEGFFYFDDNAKKIKITFLTDNDFIFKTFFHIHDIKIINLSAVYLDQKNQKKGTRLQAIAFANPKESKVFAKNQAWKIAHDHRNIGKELDIFTFDEKSGKGFTFWLENGLVIKQKIQSYLRQKEKEYGFHEVQTPDFGAVSLYYQSGHLQHYQNEMYSPIDVDGEKLMMRPMACPHHILLFEKKRRSYRELPLRYSEHARLYRYEKSGALTGLERVRSMELTDSHIFIRADQIEDEIAHCYKLINEVLTKFNIKIDHVALSLRDPQDKVNFFDDDKLWNQAESSLKKALDNSKIKYVVERGEAAFYGPKVDIQIKTILNHIITVSTIQLDFLLPKNFDLHFLDAQEKLQKPVIVHRGLIGTYERFMAILLEQTAGNFPFWLAPCQIMIIPVQSEHVTYAKQIFQFLLKAGFQVKIDLSQDRLAKKIRNAQKQKSKFQMVIGDREQEKQIFNLRAYGESKIQEFNLEDLISYLQKLNS